MLKPSAKRPKKQLTKHPFQRLLYNHPLAFWGGVWAAIILITSIAGINLFTPGVATENQAEQMSDTTLAEEPQAPPGFTSVREVPLQDQGVPLWLFGAIAVTCASGSLLIIARLNFPKQRKPVKRSQTTPSFTIRNQPAPAPTVRTQTAPSPTIRNQPAPTVRTQTAPSPTIRNQPAPAPTVRTQTAPSPTIIRNQTAPAPTVRMQTAPSPTIRNQPAPAPTARTQTAPSPTIRNQPAPAPTVSQKQPSSSQKRRSVANKGIQSPPSRPRSEAKPIVTVLPPEKSYPQDWSDNTLADMMDVRKRHSLGSLIQNP